MSLYWDMQQIAIYNLTGMELTLNHTEPLPHGEWDLAPVGHIPPYQSGALPTDPGNVDSSVVAFRTRSVNAAEVGPGPGQVIYLLPDMTTLEITFDMIFAVGQNTYAQATAGGSRGGTYSVTLTCKEDHWNGQGYRYYGMVTIGPLSNDPAIRAKQSSTAICTVTNPA